MRAEKGFCTTNEGVSSGTEIRKCNIRKYSFGRTLNNKVSLSPISYLL